MSKAMAMALKKRVWAAVVCGLAGVAQAGPAEYFGIRVVDEATGRGVPLACLETTDETRYYTDSGGWVAINEPGLMNDDVWFTVSAHGYEFPREVIGGRGLTLKTKAGERAEIKVRRVNIAERLYRVTGRGIYRDTLLLGMKPPIAKGDINAKVTGQDSALTTIYNGKLYWFWGDTDKVGFHLGNFFTTGATSLLPGKGGLAADVGVDFTYFEEKGGFTKPLVVLEQKGSDPLWVSGVVTVPDAGGKERLLAEYTRTKRLEPVERGVVLWNDEKAAFEPVRQVPVHGTPILGGHPIRVTEGGKTWLYMPGPFCGTRVLATYESVIDPDQYESFTCLKAGSDMKAPEVDRSANGKLQWAWRRGATAVGYKQAEKLVQAGLMKAEESPVRLVDAATGKPVRLQNGAVAWSAYRKKWVMIVSEIGGASQLGEIWYAEANAAEGPWGKAVKVATHAKKNDNNDFYNPYIHPEFMAADGGRYLYFEGTFTNTFSGNPHPTPRYEYNQILYRIDLADPRVALPDAGPGLRESMPAGE